MTRPHPVRRLLPLLDVTLLLLGIFILLAAMQQTVRERAYESSHIPRQIVLRFDEAGNGFYGGVPVYRNGRIDPSGAASVVRELALFPARNLIIYYPESASDLPGLDELQNYFSRALRYENRIFAVAYR